MLTLLVAIHAEAEGRLFGREWVGSGEDVVTRELQSKGWIRLRHASTGAHSWADWATKVAPKCLVIEYTNGKAVLIVPIPEQECSPAARTAPVTEPATSEPVTKNSGHED